MDNTLYERLKKMYHLSQRGINGEKRNAQTILERLMEKHNVSLSDIIDEEKNTFEFRYFCKQSEDILAHIIFMVMSDDRELRISRKYKVLIAEVANYEKVQISELFDWHWKQYKKERLRVLKELNEAYINKHNLFSSFSPSEIGYEDIDWAQVRRIQALADTMEDKSPVKSLKERCV